ncbi:hypothetical protein MXEN_17038 [Mycobacterium xenopi RIVM700367]|uniref:helix-turn-helix domain-containing protein n=1 Tax=Mycobacterium xenopi TaxID=1789 RepID=UPI00025AE948|nr:helix-turn-helix domain-containing protein [Mycobacterium xenopi]EID10877.1 hypothetical protein MXEN_17038 [Mycobacterium xenopi RIVM700367]
MTTTATGIAPEYMDEKQTAAKLGVKATSLRADRHRGVGLPYVRIAHRIRYRVNDVDAYLNANTVVPQRD